jgi:hypothetical protein
VGSSVGIDDLKKRENFLLFAENRTTACRVTNDFPCESHIFRKRVRKVIISEEK